MSWIDGLVVNRIFDYLNDEGGHLSIIKLNDAYLTVSSGSLYIWLIGVHLKTGINYNNLGVDNEIIKGFYCLFNGRPQCCWL